MPNTTETSATSFISDWTLFIRTIKYYLSYQQKEDNNMLLLSNIPAANNTTRRGITNVHNKNPLHNRNQVIYNANVGDRHANIEAARTVASNNNKQAKMLSFPWTNMISYFSSPIHLDYRSSFNK